MPIQTASARLRYIFYLYRISQFIPYMDPVPYRALLSRVQDDAQQKFSHHTSHICTLASLRYQMLGSTMSKRAWPRRSPYAFVTH